MHARRTSQVATAILIRGSKIAFFSSFHTRVLGKGESKDGGACLRFQMSKAGGVAQRKGTGKRS